MRTGSAEGMILGEGVWCLADIEISSAKTEAYDCLKKKQFVSINHLKLQKR